MRSTSTTSSVNLVSELQDRLRRIATQRISAGVITGTMLARDTGFKQAHISNFLHGHRGLSVEGFDRLLRALDLGVIDLISTVSTDSKESGEYVQVPLVSGLTAGLPNLSVRDIEDTVTFTKAFMRRLKPRMSGARGEWRRFVAWRTDARNGAAMQPVVPPSSTVLLDRHCNSLDSFRNQATNPYAVAFANRVLIRYIEFLDGHIILRPHNQGAPVHVIPAAGRRTAAEIILGRVCYVGAEL
jgi:hypothetical protein